jgi:hypothetical protein
VTGLASVPTADAPEDGRPLITVAHGTTGIADQCAPSVTGHQRRDGAGKRARQGLIAATDLRARHPGRHRTSWARRGPQHHRRHPRRRPAARCRPRHRARHRRVLPGRPRRTVGQPGGGRGAPDLGSSARSPVLPPAGSA